MLNGAGYLRRKHFGFSLKQPQHGATEAVFGVVAARYIRRHIISGGGFLVTHAPSVHGAAPMCRSMLKFHKKRDKC